MPARILVAEDDEAIAKLIIKTLSIEKHKAIHRSDGRLAMEAIQNLNFDLALLDIMLPHYDGYALLEALKTKQTPAIFITAKTALSDKVYGLNTGAEDYITKPFEALELLARVNAVIRRKKPEENLLRAGGVTLDINCHTVTKDGVPVNLSPLEYELLAFLMQNPNLLFSRDQLLDKIWGYDYFGGTRTVDMHIQKLRAKLQFSEVIWTVPKIGYRFVPPEKRDSHGKKIKRTCGFMTNSSALTTQATYPLWSPMKSFYPKIFPWCWRQPWPYCWQFSISVSKKI